MLAFFIAHDFPYVEIAYFYSKEEVALIFFIRKLVKWIRLLFIIIKGTFQNAKYASFIFILIIYQPFSVS